MQTPLASALLLLAAGLAACGGQEDPAPAPDGGRVPLETAPPPEAPYRPPEEEPEEIEEPEDVEEPGLPENAAAADAAETTGPSNADTYVVTWKSTPHPVPMNEGFSLEVRVAVAGEPDADLADLELAADAAMPDHGHGMNRKPRVTRIGPGHFQVEGMLFHMPGYWELYFDVTRGPLRERAQFAVELE